MKLSQKDSDELDRMWEETEKKLENNILAAFERVINLYIIPDNRRDLEIMFLELVAKILKDKGEEVYRNYSLFEITESK